MASDARRPLLALLVAQFLGAFNDNAWRMVVVLRTRVRGAGYRRRCRLTQSSRRARPRSGLAREDPLGRPARSHLRRVAAALSRLWR